jgi:predicted nucleotidyltransferase
MKVSLVLQEMLERVASALGPELCQQMTFVGGCTTGLLLTDDYTLEQVRHTEDVDLIVHTLCYGGFSQLQEQLKTQGFSIPAAADEAPTCAMKLGDLRVDFMPDDENVLGFGNRWYQDAMASASSYPLTDELSIRLVSPVYFMATKLEAYKGRGNNDPLDSRDIEDILNLVDGREELLDEIKAAASDVQGYIAAEISQLLNVSDFEYAVQSQARGDAGREDVIFERLEALAALTPDTSL